jgi:hypothetical protein
MIALSIDTGSTLIHLSSGASQGQRFPPVGPVGLGAMVLSILNHGEEYAKQYLAYGSSYA